MNQRISFGVLLHLKCQKSNITKPMVTTSAVWLLICLWTSHDHRIAANKENEFVTHSNNMHNVVISASEQHDRR